MAAMQAILFVELLGGIGDVLIALPAIQAIGRSYPQAQLTVLTFPPGGELLETDPLIHRVIPVRKGAARLTVEALLAHESFDLIVSDTNYDQMDQVIQQSGASRVVTNLWRSPPVNQFVGDRFVEILLGEGVITPASIAAPYLHLTSAELQQAREAIGQVSQPLVFLIPDAGMAVKRWPEANFIKLGQVLQQQYNATMIVPVGSSREPAERIAAGIGRAAKVWPRTSLRNFAAALAQADLVIAPDTGPARIAAALQVPTITLFGPSWHGRYGQPLPHVNLQGYPDCPERVIQNFTEQRCWYGGVCPFDRWDTCLEAISVDRVMTAVRSVLNAKAQIPSF